MHHFEAMHTRDPLQSAAERGSLMTEDLVARARRGDHAAFGQLAAERINRLYAIAHRVLRDPNAAEDAVQECFLHAWRDIRVLRDADRLDAWLYRLLLNACRDEQRRVRRRPMEVSMATWDPTNGRDDVADVERRDELERGFRRLTSDHRMVLVLHHYLGLRAREIGDLLGIPEGTVVSRIHYGGRALRLALEPDLGPAATTPGGRS